MKTSATKVRVADLSLSKPTGIRRLTLAEQPAQQYLLYRPRSFRPGKGVLAMVHGVARTPSSYLRPMRELAEFAGQIVVAPVYDEARHRDYQRLGRTHLGPRADHVLDACVAEAAAQHGADASALHLVGFSGGAQFVHRYVMAYPDRVAAAVAIAAGWYTMPDMRVRFPYGIRASSRLPYVTFDPRAFLRVPLTVLVGAVDTGSDNLRRNGRLDASQGSNRVERARTWVRTMRLAARACGLEPRVELVEVPNVGHSFEAFVRRGRLLELTCEALYGRSFVVPGTDVGVASEIAHG